MPKAKETRPSGGEVGASQEEAREFHLDQEVAEPTIESTQEQETPVVESEEQGGSREGETEGVVVQQAPAPAPAPVRAPKDPLTQKIESVLEEDLAEVYQSMPPEKQAEFRAKGEEVTGKIRVMVETAKFSLRKALGLIRDWLKIIPGVNKFFLEQEAKIKADKISDIANGG